MILEIRISKYGIEKLGKILFVLKLDSGKHTTNISNGLTFVASISLSVNFKSSDKLENNN